MNHHLRFPAGSRRVEAALVGAGAFGRSFLSQSRRMKLLSTRIAVDRDASTAAAGLAAAGVAAAEIAACTTGAEARAAWERGHCIATGQLECVLDLPFEILVEASGQPEPAAAASLAAMERGKHVALVSKEADSVVGPFLAAEAARHGVICTPVDGDQPSLLIDLVTWAEILGLEIIAAGKSSEYDFVYDPAAHRVTTQLGAATAADFGRVWDLPGGAVADTLSRRTKLLGLPTHAVPDLCEMGIVANATGLTPDTAAFHAPILRIPEVPSVFDTQEEGGILTGTRRVDVFNCLRLPHEISFAGGVFVTVRCTDAATWRVLEEKGHVLSRTGRAGLIFNPRHLLGIEAPFSVLDAVLNGRSSAGRVRPVVDLVARAVADLPAGRLLAAEGHHHEIQQLRPELVAAVRLGPGRPVPYYLLANKTLLRPVAAGELLTLDDIDFSAGSALLEMRRRQDGMAEAMGMIRPTEIFDAHHHFWDLAGGGHYPWLQDAYNPEFFLGDYRSLQRNFLPADLRAAYRQWNLTGSVHVEAERSRREQVAETRWLAGLHAATGLPTLIVGHVYFTQPDRDAVLAGHAACPLVRGIRSKPVIAPGPGHTVRGQPGTLQDKVFAEGLAALEWHHFSWDLRVPFWHLQEAAELLAEFPTLPVVVNHLGLPLDRSPEALAVWRRGLAALAARPHTTLKVSELGLHGGVWDEESNRKVVAEAVAIYGYDRCMFASNLPVSGLSVSLDRLIETVLASLPEATQAEIDALFAGTARRFYRA